MGRRRRTAEEAKAEILASAQRTLVQSGPDAIRLDEIAKELGVSRQAVLHHFGSREELLREVVRIAWLGLFESLQGLAQRASEGMGPLITHLDDVTRKQGNARVGAWLMLSKQGLPEDVFAGALAELPKALRGKDADLALLLVGAALFGDAIFGERLRQALGLDDSETERQRFHRFLLSAVAGASSPPDR